VGVGGMGVVVLALHKQLDERVALKFLRRDAMTRPDIVERFSQEARAAVKLKSEHVARVMDVGVHDGIPFMVMEYLEGEDLRAYIDKQGPMSVVEACEFLIHACEGLGEAHARGIVHRDIKPENLFVLERAGERMIKLLDFGISKVALTGRATDIQTHGPTQGVMGSPYYMSPEQLRSTKDVDRRADIWALGAVLFEMLCGETAFSDTEEFTELVAEILERPNRNITEVRRDVPAALEAVINKCLAKDREQRYQSTGALAVDLAPFVRSRARAIASRSVAIATAAGFAKDLRVHDSMPPPSMSGLPFTLQPGAGATPSMSNRTATSPEGALAVPPRPASGGVKAWMLAPLVAVLLIGALVWGAKSGSSASIETPPTATPGTNPPTAVTVTQTAPIPSLTATPDSAQDPMLGKAASTASASATTTSHTQTAAGTPHGPSHWPPAKPIAKTTAAAPTATAAGPSLEIRRER
jgi:eukaryotic-like serine/threonine-protein kinase